MSTSRASDGAIAACLTAPGRICLETVPLPAPGPGQVRVRVTGCGLCGSNLPVWRGQAGVKYPMTPGAPGHEGWGTIDALGPEVDGLASGEPVVFLSDHAFASHDLAAASAVVRLPVSLRDKPFPGEPLACAINVLKRCDIVPGQTVAVVGVGFIGALVIRLAIGAGARVVALSRRAYALDMARNLGAEHCIGLGDIWRACEQAKRIRGQGYERVIECVGSQESLDLASELCAERGRLIIAGYHQDGLRRVNLQQWNWRGLDVINAHERDPARYVVAMQEAVERVTRGELDPGPLLTHAFPLEEIAVAFKTLVNRPSGFLKAYVTAS